MEQLAILRSIAESLGVTIDQESRDRLLRYRELLLEWNQRFNLTRVTDPREIEIKLFADALALKPVIDRFRARQDGREPLRLIDVGTGAGFPGIPLAIVEPNLDILLLEATGKKVAFLDAVIGELELGNVTALHARAEQAAHNPELRQRFDLVTARAVAHLTVLFELCLPFCRAGGWGVFPKGPSAPAEADEARRAASLLGARIRGVEPASSPELAGTMIVIVEQHGQVAARYPRRPGLPAKQPL